MHDAPFWRMAVGLCYMHAILVQDLQTTASSVFYNTPPLTLVPLIHAARLVAQYQNLSAGFLMRITRMLVTNVCYAPHFRRWSPHLLVLLDECFSMKLLRDPSQLIVLNVTLDAPDASMGRGWKALLDFSRTLCNTVRSPWLSSTPACLRTDAEVEFSIKMAAMLEKTKRHTFSSMPNHVAIKEQAQILYDMIPKGDILRLDPPQREMTCFEETLRVMIVHEFESVKRRTERVTADLYALLQACTGRNSFSDLTLALYVALSQNMVPRWWDVRTSAASCPTRWFVEDLKLRYAYFHAKLCAYGISRGGKNPRWNETRREGKGERRGKGILDNGCAGGAPAWKLDCACFAHAAKGRERDH